MSHRAPFILCQGIADISAPIDPLYFSSTAPFVYLSRQNILQRTHADPVHRLLLLQPSGILVMPETCHVLMCSFHRGCTALLKHAEPSL